MCDCNGTTGNYCSYHPSKNGNIMSAIQQLVSTLQIPHTVCGNDQIPHTVCGNDQIPHTVCGNDLMVCSPVGNEGKFDADHQATVVLSGFCTAPEAALDYLKSLDSGTLPVEAAIRNAFNTTPMKSGVIKLLDSLGVPDPSKLFYDCVDPNTPTCTLFTQMLCMISPNGSSKAIEVWDLLCEQNIFVPQAEQSLTAWLKRIQVCLMPGGLILLMGNESQNLLDQAHTDGSQVSLFKKGTGMVTLRHHLTQQFQICQVYHAAALRRPSLLKSWYCHDLRKQAYEILQDTLIRFNSPWQLYSLPQEQTQPEDAPIHNMPSAEDISGIDPFEPWFNNVRSRTEAILIAMHLMGPSSCHKTDSINWHPLVLIASIGANYLSRDNWRSRHNTNVNATLLILQGQGHVVNTDVAGNPYRKGGYWKLTNSGCVRAQQKTTLAQLQDHILLVLSDLGQTQAHSFTDITGHEMMYGRNPSDISTILNGALSQSGYVQQAGADWILTGSGRIRAQELESEYTDDEG